MSIFHRHVSIVAAGMMVEVVKEGVDVTSILNRHASLDGLVIDGR